MINYLLAANMAASKPTEYPFARREILRFEQVKPQSTLTLRVSNGSVTVRPGKEGHIVVKELIRAPKLPQIHEISFAFTRTKETYTLLEEDNFVTPGDPSAKWPGATDYSPPLADLTLYVPRDVNLAVSDSNGHVSVAGVRGEVNVSAPNGGIDFECQTNQIGQIFAQTYNGKIESSQNVSEKPNPKVALHSYNSTIKIKDPAPTLDLGQVLVFVEDRFKSKHMYVADGSFTETKPELIDKVIDLKGKYLVSAYGDAHCHHIDGASLASWMSPRYLKEGTVYVQSMGNHAKQTPSSRTVVNHPNSVDASFANAGFTSEFGHPAFLYESLANPTPKELTPQQRTDALRGKKTGSSSFGVGSGR